MDSSCSRCGHCVAHQDIADQLDIWKMALAALKNEEWPEAEPVTPSVVMELASFLQGGAL